MTKAQMVQVIIENTRRRDKAALIDTAIDLAMTEVGQLHPFRAATLDFTGVINTADTQLTLPSDFWHIVELRIVQGAISSEIEIRDKSWVLDRYPNMAQTQTGRPVLGYVEWSDKTVRFLPPSNQTWTYKGTYIKLYATLGTNDEVPVTGLDNALIAWASAYVFRSTQQYQDANMHMQEYGRALLLLKTSDLSNNSKRTLSPFNGTPREYSSTRPELDPFNRDGRVH